jgi:hypothetical protein
VELALFDSVTHPVKTHVHSFGVLLLNGVVDNAKGSGVVGLDGCGGLWMAHFFEGSAEWDSFFGV